MMGATREKGKIPRAEWAAIVARSLEGESLASIARHYKCTAPAIRYIVRRSASSPMQAQAAPSRSTAPAARARPERPEPGRADEGTASGGPVPVLDPSVRDRVTNDIASFLVALEAAVVEPNLGNFETVRSSTDRLMRAAARTLLELERVIASLELNGRLRDRAAANGR